MLHAILHHKLDESVPVSRRLEDAVTSSVFGTLLFAGAGEQITAWINTATGAAQSPPSITGALRAFWFWPRLALAEPDIVLRFDDRIVIVEAKVASDRHDLMMDRELETEDWTSVSNQLCRQWLCAAAPEPGPGCPPDLAAALRSLPKTLVFLVDERRLHRARPEFDETLKQLPADADLRLLTWQLLHRDLVRHDSADAGSFWRGSLIEYLERAGLAGFVGFRQVPLPTLAAIDAIVQRRWNGSARTRGSWREFPAVHGASTLLRWTTRGGARSLPALTTTALSKESS